MKETMGDRIRYYREKIGMTQEELGEKLGVQNSAIVKYEKGRVVNIKRSSIKIMADLFGVSPSYLAYGVEEPASEEAQQQETDTATELTPNQEQFLSVFSDLSEADQDRILVMMRALSQNK